MDPRRCDIARRAGCHLLLVALGGLSLGCGGRPQERIRWHPVGANDIRCVAFSPDGKSLAVGVAGVGKAADAFWKGRVDVYDAATGELSAQREVPMWVNSLSYSPDGSYLAVGTGAALFDQFPVVERTPTPGAVVLLAAADLTEKGSRRGAGEDSEIDTVVFHSDGKAVFGLVRVAPRGTPGAVYRWSVPALDEESSIGKPQECYSALALSADGKTLLVGDRITRDVIHPTHGLLRLFDSSSGKHVSDVELGSPSFPTAIAVAPAGDLVVATGQGDRDQVVDLGRKATVDDPALTFTGSGSERCPGAFSQDGRWHVRSKQVSNGRSYARIAMRDRKSGKTVSWEEGNCWFNALCFSRDGKWLAAGGSGPAPDGAKSIIVVWRLP